MSKEYNTTQLSPNKVFERHVYHRDQFAHYLRWAHVLKVVPSKVRILDVGCGSGNLLEVLYHNRRVPELYVGVDVRTQTIKNNTVKFGHLTWVKFTNLDFCKYMSGMEFYKLKNSHFNFVTCFEVIEHLGKQNGDQFLFNISSLMRPETVLLISTPCYNGEDVAQNHVINGEVGEYTFQEMRYELEKFFKIEKVWGTFASQKDYLERLTPEQKKIWDKLNEYYDPDLVSVLLAPLFPERARNCLWQCRIR
jgi:2-polyprenyl-3-methyl-5-hydroxy-6-metoxy-1,4-benzoquinol methylase